MQSMQDYIFKKLLSKKVDDAIVSLNELGTTQINFSNNKIVATTEQSFKDIGIFISNEKKVVSTTLKNLSKNSVDKTITAVLKFLKCSEQSKEYFGIAEGPFEYKKIKDIYDKKVLEINAVDIAEKGIKEALSLGVKNAGGIFRTNEAYNRVVTSGGVDAESRYTKLYFSVRTSADKYASGHDVSVSNTINNFDINGAVKNAAEIALNSKNTSNLLQGKYDILFTPLAAANIIMHIGEMASSYKVDTGFSCLKGKIGHELAIDKINIFDDGKMPNGFNSRIYDAEGVPSQKTAIIKNGVLKNYLHNTSTAKKHTTDTTANAGLIAPRPTNIVLQEGKSKKEDLIKEMRKGLIVTNVWYTRFQNYEKGEFSTIPRDGIFFVKNGNIKHAVKEIRINSNLLEILRNISDIGNNTKQILSWEVDTPVFTPSILVKNINVTKPK